MIKYFIYAYLFVILVGFSKASELPTDKLTDAQKEAMWNIEEFRDVDYKHICYDCEIKYKGVDRIEYWKNNKLYWSDILIGSGSGIISKTSMGAAPATVAGDRLLIVDGSYTTTTLTNLNNLTILPQSGNFHTVFNSGTITMNNNVSLDVSYLSSIGASSAFNISSGNNRHIRWHHIYIKNCSGAVWNFGVNKVYTWGDSTTTQMYMCSQDSITMSAVGQWLVGSFVPVTFVSMGGPLDIVDSFRATNIHLDSVTNQDQIHGIFNRWYSDNIYNIDPQTSSQVTDKGFWNCAAGWGDINGYIGRYYQYGGRGKMGRFLSFTIGAVMAELIVENSAKFNTTNFGLLDAYANANESVVSGHTVGAHTTIRNCTAGNMTSVNPFPCPIVFVVTQNNGDNVKLRNLLAFNNFLDGNGNIYNSSGGTWTVDTAKCWRYTSATAAKLDSTGAHPTFKPLLGSPVIGVGIAVVTTLDYYSVPYGTGSGSGYPIGYAMLPPSAIPCNGCVFYKRLTKGKQG